MAEIDAKVVENLFLIWSKTINHGRNFNNQQSILIDATNPITILPSFLIFLTTTTTTTKKFWCNKQKARPLHHLHQSPLSSFAWVDAVSVEFTGAMGGAVEAYYTSEDLGLGLRLDHHAEAEEPPNEFFPPQTPWPNRERRFAKKKRKKIVHGGWLLREKKSRPHQFFLLLVNRF